MTKISTQKALLLLLSVALFGQCKEVPPVASELVFVSATENKISQRSSTDCAFRYDLANTFTRLDDKGQRAAIQAGFDLWQTVNPNIGFLNLPQKARLIVKFVDPLEIPNSTVDSKIGLVHDVAAVTGGLHKESNGTYTILLSNIYSWDKNSLMKSIAYHAGLYMGMATSSEPNSLMSTHFIGQSVKASKDDSVAINKLYSMSCKDLTVSYLPLSLTVGGPISKTVKFDKQGTISIKASGEIQVGNWVGTSGPEGRPTGVLGVGLGSFGYNIIPEWNHAVLMYKLNNETNWHNCGKECSFTTNGLQYVDLIFNINDNDLSTNIGGYNLTIDYK